MEKPKNIRIKIVFSSPNSKPIIVEEENYGGDYEDKIISDLQTPLKLGWFPTASFRINTTNKQHRLTTLKLGDNVSIYVSYKVEKVFEGMLKIVKGKVSKDSIELTIEAISRFYNLQNTFVNYSSFINKYGLREILNELVEQCNINGTVEISKNISNEFHLTPFNNFPAFSLLHSICYDLDLIYIFGSNNILSISTRKEKLEQKPPVLDLPDDFSFEFK